MRKRSTGIAAIILLTIAAIGCGQTFRPIATPIIEPGGDPNTLKRAVVVTDNGAARGGVSIIDTTGDTNLGNVQAGIGPVHAGFVTVARTYVVNQAENTVTRILTSTPGSTPATIPMPVNCNPQYVFNRLTANAYVACPGNDTVAVLSAGQDSVVTSVALAGGANPVAINQSFNGAKVYSLNSGDGTVTVIATLDNTVSGTIAVGGSPLWSEMNEDGTLLFVLNAGGYVSVIDTTTDALAAGTVVPTNTIALSSTTPAVIAAVSPNFMVFDTNKRRLYVTDRGAGALFVIDANKASPTFGLVNGVTVGTDPRSVTALKNGTKAYVANCGSDSVSVIDATSLAVSKTINTGTCPISVASPTDSTRAVVGVMGAAGGTDPLDPPSILDISTQTDTVIVNLKPAQRSASCTIDGVVVTYCPLQQPVFVVMTP